jgi:hypothetical protein
VVAEEKHIIEKVRVKLTTPSVAEAHELKNNFSAYFADYVLPYIETYLDELFRGKNKRTVRMNQLKLSLNLDNVLSSKDELISQLKKLLDERFIAEKADIQHHSDNVTRTNNPEEDDLKILDNETHYFEAVCFFLAHGSCPWWLSNEKLSFLLEEKNLQSFFASQPHKTTELFAQVNSSKIVQKRLIAQFSFRFLIWLIQQVHPRLKKLTAKQLSFIEGEIQYFSREEYVLFFQRLFEIPAQEKNLSVPRVQQFLHLISSVFKRANPSQEILLQHRTTWVNIVALIAGQDVKNNEIETALDTVLKQPIEELLEDALDELEEDTQLPEEGMYIDNAGMVLLHPFLKHFFTNAGLLENGKELEDKELAVQLLHFIATGKENDWEHTMLFEKFLCNMPLDSPLIKKSLITKKHKKEVTELLNAVLENWKALGNSSIELLRNEFLSRPGKLFQDNVSPRLVVERKTQDILLDRISWNISIVKLPWSKQILYATW